MKVLLTRHRVRFSKLPWLEQGHQACASESNAASNAPRCSNHISASKCAKPRATSSRANVLFPLPGKTTDKNQHRKPSLCDSFPRLGKRKQYFFQTLENVTPTSKIARHSEKSSSRGRVLAAHRAASADPTAGDFPGRDRLPDAASNRTRGPVGSQRPAMALSEPFGLSGYLSVAAPVAGSA